MARHRQEQRPPDRPAGLLRSRHDPPPRPRTALCRTGGGLVDSPLFHAALRHRRDTGTYSCGPHHGGLLLQYLRFQPCGSRPVHSCGHGSRVGIRGQRHFRGGVLSRDRTALRKREGPAALVGIVVRSLLRRQHHHDRKHCEYCRSRNAGKTFPRSRRILSVVQDRGAGGAPCRRYRLGAPDADVTADAGPSGSCKA